MTNGLTVARRRWLLSAHVLLSAGWFGATLCFVALGIVATRIGDSGMLASARAIISILDPVLLRPLAVGTAATGILLSVLTRWGLFRFYWIVAKELLTLLSIGAGVVVMGRVPVLIDAGASGGVSAAPGRAAPDINTLLLLFALQLVLLAASVVISVLKPWRQKNAPVERAGQGHSHPATEVGTR